MFQRMLLPLDGSKRAERAIPIAARIARASRGSLIFLRAVGTQIEFGTYMTEPSVLIREALELDLTRVIDYLARIKMSNELTGIETTVEVRSGGVAQTILDVAQMRISRSYTSPTRGDGTGGTRWLGGSGGCARASGEAGCCTGSARPRHTAADTSRELADKRA